ncbi:amino acid adenylation domain-containing protein [Lysinibacillus sphaericus]|uniref:Amino acid adenylation domain-containing protein n=1 Tax=Lysinibacillus sphaericus TaxID=1421 RepID=A0A544V0Q7_LYSSH|nr:non-ribosomal peptide synthetase [Lysinibacillus sp. SDF0037]TQR39692.1 amino acid adenylation domain-containing protein [Lysinibacillus sp. SDF0037]
MLYEEVEYYELTHPQKRIWYIDKINSGSTLHNIGGSLNINGPINIEIMKKTINLVIKNNEGLRLQFTEVDDKPMQYVMEFKEHEINFLDFSNYSVPEEEYRKWVEIVFKRNFDLSGGPLFYLAIYKISEKKYGVLLNVHHIISDGWSIALIQKQICEFYNQLIHDQGSVFDENCSYINFIKSEEKYNSSKRFIKNKDFWVGKLKNPPNEFLYNGAASLEGARSSIKIDTGLSRQIQDFVHNKKCSLNTFFTAVMMIYIYKVTNEKDLIMGTSVFNRTNRVQRNAVGMFTSTMPLRFLMNSELSTGDLITQINDEIISCFFNQKYPYDLIIQDLELSKSGYDSLFRMTMNYYNVEMESKIGGFDATVDEYYNGNQSYSMQLSVKEWAEKNIRLDFDYKTKEYTETEIKTMQKAIIYIAEQLIDEKLLIKDMQLVCDNEIHDRLYHFNANKNHYPCKTVSELFEEQVAKYPHKIALEFKGDVLTYEKLNEKVNRLADYLLEQGVGKKTIVSVLQTHSLELVISILGILKAGGTYLPIDPDYPINRINYLLKDSGSKFLITNIGINGLDFNGEIININNLDLNLYSSKNPSNKNSIDDLAYIIYTSGTTGMPKGVVIKHQGLTNYICWANKTYLTNENEAMALYSSIAFDLTVTSVFMPLISGQKIVIYDNDENEFILYKILRENKVTVIKLTPAHLVLLKGIDYTNSKVKKLIVGGEDLKVSLAKEINDGFGDVEIYNEYGPTETVVGCMIHKYKEENDTSLSVPIGCPIDNTHIYILNADLNVMPVGLPGELYISGDGVAKGYLNNSELTQRKFVDNPFVSGQKMYKTGDMARYLESGLIEYIGRSDKQVKIRGHRIELGEIERCLTVIPGVKNAVIVLKQSLNAYIVAEDISEYELKEKLAEMLPRYMMPTNFVFIDQLPLTLNGKIDISLLPEPEVKRTEFETAVTLIEKELVSMISEVLGVDDIDMNDNFYHLGGDSINAIQISSRLMNIGYVIKAKDILSFETIKEIAAAVQIADNGLIDQGMASGSFELTPIMKWFFEQNFANENHYNQSIVLKVEHFDINKIKKALVMLIEHHDALRLNYDRLGERLYYNNQVSDITVDYFDLSVYSSEEQDLLIEEQGFKLTSDLDIEKDLLLKAGAFNLGVRGHLLFLTAHHLVVDGVSWRIILEDFDNLLSATNDQEMKLPLKTHSFMEWSNWLKKYSENSFDYEKKYWLNTLAHHFDYPYDFNTGLDTVSKSATLSMELEIEKTNQLLTKVNDVYGIGVQETLTIALATIIKDLTGQNDVVIELEGHGREEMDSGINISRTIGWFTSLYPLSLKIQDKNLDFNLKSLKEQIRKIPNKGLDFGVLKYLKNEFNVDSASYVRFNYLGNDESSKKRKSFQLAHGGYKFDTDTKNTLTAILDINAMIIDGKLIIAVVFSRNKFLEETIGNLLNMYINRIKEIIELSSSKTHKNFTPSDFSASDISQDDLDSLFV